MSTKRQLFKQTAIYTMSDGISKGLSFLALPLVSHYLVPEELGIAANFDVLLSILMLLAGQSIVNSLPYFYYGKTMEERGKFISNLLFIIVVSNILFLILILLFTCNLEKYLHISLALQLLTLVTVISQLINATDLIVYRMEEKPFSFAKLQLSYTILSLSILCALVIRCELGALGKILSVVIASTVLSTIHFYLLYKRHYIVFSIDLSEIKSILRFGIPLLPHSLSFWFKSGFDKIILTTYCGLAANGLYSMAMSFGAMFTIFNSAFSNSFIPYLQKRLNNITEENKKNEVLNIVRLSYKLMAGFILISLVVIFFCWVAITYFLDEKYVESFQFIPWIITGLCFNAIYGIVIQFPYTVKKTLGMGIITFSGSIIQLILTFLLVSRFGVDGIKLSYVLGCFIIMIGVWIYSNKVYPMPWINAIFKRK